MRKTTKVVIGATACLATIIGLGIGLGHNTHTPLTSTSSTTSPTTTPSAATVPSTSSSIPACWPNCNTTPTTIPSTSTPTMTLAEQQAVSTAQNYLSDGQGFSYQGLLQQLTSSYVSGFSSANATFAINYIHPDWDAQAVETAQGYLNSGEGFSRASLIQQLTSSYGSGFTEAQAIYAVNKVGL